MLCNKARLKASAETCWHPTRTNARWNWGDVLAANGEADSEALGALWVLDPCGMRCVVALQ